MPLYYFDTDNGTKTYRDDIGSELPDEQAARDEATSVLMEMAKYYLPGRPDPQRNVSIWVRDSDGRPILHLTLTFAVKPLT